MTMTSSATVFQIDHDTLLAAGYQYFKPYGNKAGYEDDYQKAVRDGNGVLLFHLDAFRYDLRRSTGGEGWQFNTQYHIPEGFFDLNLVITPAMTLEWIEAWLEQAYWRLGCIPDPHND